MTEALRDHRIEPILRQTSGIGRDAMNHLDRSGFEGEAHDEDRVIEAQVEVVKSAIHELLQRGLRERNGIFS